MESCTEHILSHPRKRKTRRESAKKDELTSLSARQALACDLISDIWVVERERAIDDDGQAHTIENSVEGKADEAVRRGAC
jgi:hypothetical protein